MNTYFYVQHIHHEFLKIYFLSNAFVFPLKKILNVHNCRILQLRITIKFPITIAKITCPCLEWGGFRFGKIKSLMGGQHSIHHIGDSAPSNRWG